MKEEFCYFVIPEVKTSRKEDLNLGTRIVCLPLSFNITTQPENSEGPFFNLKTLIDYSLLYNQLKKTNSKRANKIIQEKYILKADDFALLPVGTTFNKDFINALTHSIKGEFKNNSLVGVHYYNENDTEIIEKIDQNHYGIWSAKIKKRDSKGNWIQKEKTSTFFPIDWSKGKITEEIFSSLDTIKVKEGKTNIYQSTTISGITIEFIIVNSKIKTIYPIL